MDLSEKIQYAINNKVFLLAKGSEIIVVDAIDAKRLTDCMPVAFLLPEYRFICDDPHNYQVSDNVLRILIEDNTFNSELKVDTNKRIGYAASIYNLKKAPKEKKVKEPSATSMEEVLIKLLKQIENRPDKIIDVTKFNRETFSGAKVVDRPKGVLRTRIMYDGYPFITSERITNMSAEEFNQTNMGTAIQFYQKLQNKGL